jgi:hypothetical protein
MKLSRRSHGSSALPPVCVLVLGGVAFLNRGPSIAIPDHPCADPPPLRTHDGVTLQPVAMQAFREEAERTAHTTIAINASFRSCAQQAIACRNICGNPQGCPGRCAPAGLLVPPARPPRVDLTQGSLDNATIVSAMKSAGWCEPLPSERPRSLLLRRLPLARAAAGGEPSIREYAFPVAYRPRDRGVRPGLPAGRPPRCSRSSNAVAACAPSRRASPDSSFLSLRFLFRIRPGDARTYEKQTQCWRSTDPSRCSSLLAVWLILVQLGVRRHVLGAGAESFREALIISGSSLFTLGFALKSDSLPWC